MTDDEQKSNEVNAELASEFQRIRKTLEELPESPQRSALLESFSQVLRLVKARQKLEARKGELLAEAGLALDRMRIEMLQARMERDEALAQLGGK